MKQLTLEICKKLKEIGFNVPTLGCYYYNGENWNYYELAYSQLEDDGSGISLIEDDVWDAKEFLDVFSIYEEDKEPEEIDGIVIYESWRKINWNLDIKDAIITYLELPEDDEPTRNLLSELVLDPGESITPEKELEVVKRISKSFFAGECEDLFDYYDTTFYLIDKGEEDEFICDSKYVKNIRNIGSLRVNDKSYEEYKPDECTYKITSGGAKLIFDLSEVNLPFIHDGKFYSVPTPQEVIWWLENSKGIHIGSDFKDGVWTFVLCEHPSTKVESKFYEEGFQEIINSVIEYLSIIQ